MRVPPRLVVFDALSLRCFALGDQRLFREELSAFGMAFRGRKFRLLVTDGILAEYQAESNNFPQYLPLPVLNNLADRGRAIFLDELRLQRHPVALDGFPSQHKALILDSIAAGAEYFITKRSRWLAMNEESVSVYGLHIVTPARFVELEG